MKKTLIVCLLSNKGGSGKTTISTAIAGELHRQKLSGLLIDLDPQGSASRWHQQRDDDEPGVIPAQAHQLPGIVERANEAAADFLIIDTPPHSDSASLAAARVADVILAPARPGLADVAALEFTKDLIAIAKKLDSAYVVINAAPHAAAAAEAKQAIAATYHLNICPIPLAQRIAYSHAFTAGLSPSEYDPSSKAGAETKKLAAWLLKISKHSNK